MKLGKLKKKMPEKKGMEKEDMEGMETSEMESEGEEMAPEEDYGMELGAEMGTEEPAMEEMGSPMEAISDEELMAELKKRGLMSQLEEGEEDSMEQEMPMA